MPKFKDLTDKTFGKLIAKRVFGKNKKGDTIWECDCECGNKSYPSISNLNRKNGTQSCGCIGKLRANNNAKWKGHEEISGKYWYIIHSNAKHRNIEFNITIEYLWDLFVKQNKKCAITNLPISVIHSGDNRNRHFSTASLDRIDPNKGYIEGNVQWVLKKINQIKMDMNLSDFINLCNLVAKTNPKSDIAIEKFVQTTDWLRIRGKRKKKEKENE